ncbi:MAG: alpha-N-arabinofuranosidase, partial [Chloroflexota bacterium]|nr:alpha-N-arabinofuranosidase [Chloroflexota bacterium]
AGGLIDYVSIHLYGASRHLYTPEDDEFESTVGQALHFEEELRAYADLVAQEARRAGVERPLALALDEWNIRHLEPETWPTPAPGPDGRIAPRDLPPTDPAAVRRVRVNRWSPRTLADALFYAGVFHALHRLCGHTVPVGMANTVNLINANALLAVRPSGLVQSATYHVWDLYQNHMGRTCLPVTVECPSVLRPVRRSPQLDVTGQLPARPALVPYLDGVATLSDDRRTLHVCVINRHRTAAVRAPIRCTGPDADLPPRARHWEIGAGGADVLATNGLDTPDCVALRGGGTVEVPPGGYVFPPHAVTLLSFEIA